MRKCLRVCVEARDVFAARALRAEEGIRPDVFFDLQLANIVVSSLVDAGLLLDKDIPALVPHLSVQGARFIVAPDALLALGEKIRTSFSERMGSSNKHEMTIFNSVLPAVLELCSEVALLFLARDTHEVTRRGRRLHERHDGRLTRFVRRCEFRYLEHMHEDQSVVASHVGDRMLFLRKANQRLKRRAAYNATKVSSGASPEGAHDEGQRS